MGFFDTKEIVYEDPLAAQKTSAADYLKNLLSQNVPQQEVAPLSDIMNLGRDVQKGYVTGGTPTAYSTAYDQINKLLQPIGDLTKNPSVQAMLDAITTDTSDIVNQLNRQFQLGSGGNTGTQVKGVTRGLAEGQNRMLAQLLGLYENERSRQMQALGMLPQLGQLGEQSILNRISSSQYDPQQAYAQAVLNAIFQKQMAPFTTQAGIASNLGGMSLDRVIQPEASLAETILPLVGQLGSSAILAGALI